MYKKHILILLTALLINTLSFSQSLSFSYFFPKNGYFSTPIAPLNLGLPLNFGSNFCIKTGISYYAIGGMNVKGLPEGFSSELPVVGPFQSFSLKLIPTIMIPSGDIQIDLHGGIAGFATFNTRLINENLDKMILDNTIYNAINSNYEINEDKFGYAYVTGITLNFKVKKGIWGHLGAMYYIGQKNMQITNNYEGFIKNSTNFYEQTIDFNDIKLDYSGLELIIGVTLKK